MSILLVDDCEQTLDAMRALLERHGHFAIQLATGGQEALDLLGSADLASPVPVDVVVTDISMPGIDGIELCRRIKQSPHLADIPVLVVTGAGDETTLAQAFAAGASDFIPKPVNPTELLARLNSALRLKQELDKRKAHERELLAATEQLQRLNQVLHRLSVRDELTGIANRRCFNLLLKREWARAAREGVPCALMVIDIDFFKGYNDHYGHLVGDRCLKRVATALEAEVKRPGDFIARYGGEEFVVLLTNTDARGAQVVARSLCAGVAALDLEHAESRVADHVTISVGVAVAVARRDLSAEQVLAAADQALYQAKADGRDRVVMAPEPLADGRPTTRITSLSARRSSPRVGGKRAV